MDLVDLSTPKRKRLGRLAVLCAAVLVSLQARAAADPLSHTRASLYNAYAAQLARFADQAENDGASALADRLRAWQPGRRADKIYVVDLHALPSEAPPPVGGTEQLQQRFTELRKQQATALFQLAQKAAATGHTSLALMLVGETLREDPDHAAARKVLGYQRTGAEWRTAYAAKKVRAGHVWHKTFGWLPTDHVARYESGERSLRGRWVSAEQEARVRSNISRGWEIETEHFAVTTNHSHEAGVRLALQLERLYDVWWQLFAGYHLSHVEVQRLLSTGTAPRRPTRRHKVVYFRDRDEYSAALRKMQPGVERTLGIYFADVRTAYFFAGDEQDPGTLFHEATHQMFQEARPTKKIVSLRDNFWIIEGIACYMESLQLVGDYATVGGLDEGRLPAARVRLLKDGFYVPLDELVALGTQQMQQHPRARTLYSQAAGQAAFLMHYRQGHYREALLEYLQEVYRGAARPQSLARATGASYEQLDQQYREFLKSDNGKND